MTMKKKNVLIPQSVTCESRKYAASEIDSKSLSFKCMNSVQFPEDSEVRAIADSAFFESDLESITIPSSVVDNTRTNNSSNVKDVLLFVRRDIETAITPSFVKVIAPCAFNSCYCLSKIEFEEKSELKYTEDNAFLDCTLESLVIPQHVVKMGKFAFCNCKIKKVEFAENSELRYVDDSAFSSAYIESIVIPPNVVHIGVNSLSNCSCLKKVEFSDGTKMDSLGEFIFQSSSIEQVSIQSSVFELERGWNSQTRNLIDIKISPNHHNFKYIDDTFLLGKANPLNDIFDVLHFVRRDAQKVTIPSFIKRIGSYALCSCTNLNEVEFPEDSAMQKTDESAFSNSSLEKLTIHSNITEIGSYSFCSCEKLTTIEFDNNSKLIKIDSFAFFYSSLIEITIPSSVLRIFSHAFSSCIELKKVVFSKDSNIFYSIFL